MTLAEGEHALALTVAALLWLAVAVVITLIGLRRWAEANRAIAEAHAVGDLLGTSPGAPMLVYPNDAVDADPRIADWMGLGETPLRLSDLFPVLAGDGATRLAEGVESARTAGREIAVRLPLEGTTSSVIARGQPYRVPGRGLDAVLLWIYDITVPQLEISGLEERNARLGRALDGLSALIDAAPFPMWHRGPELDLALVNLAYVRALEAESAQDVVSRGLELLEAGRDLDARAGAAEARERGDAVTRNAPAIVAGERRMMRVVDVPVGEAGVAGYAIDIQEIEEAREELSAFAFTQRELLDRLSAGVVQFAADRSLVFHNRHFAAIFSMAPEWLADEPDFDRVLERMREAERAPESRDFPGWRAGRRAWFGATAAIEESWLLPGGTHLRVVAQPLPDRGLVVIFEDRTEHLRLASARDTLLRVRAATFDNLFEAVGVFAANGRLQLWNHRFDELWNLGEEELGKRPRVDTLAQALAPRLIDPSRATLVRDTVRVATHDRQHRSGRISLKDGRHYEFAAVPLPDGNALFTLLDVTATRENEEALLARNDALEEANRLKNTFVESMSYELRVPLTSIAGFAEMLAEGYAGELTETARDYVGAIVEAVGRLSAITGDVLDLAQSEIGSLPMEMEPLPLTEVMRGLLDRARDGAWSSGRTLAADVPADCGMIAGDRRRLAQALDHLLRNALQYTPEGGRVLLRARRQGSIAEITLSDNGPGMGEEQQRHAFDRIRRTVLDDSPDPPAAPSRGFGLPLARQLIEAHGGTLELRSELGVGTTLRIALPAEGADA